MSPDDLIRLRHMAEAAQAALDFSRGRRRADLEADTMLRFAPIHAVQIIGEAAGRVSAAGRAEAAAIDWPAIVGMRNRLVHAYFDVNTDILWSTVTKDLPLLVQRLRAVKGVAEPGGSES